MAGRPDARRRRLSAEDWTAAALEALRRDGPGAVAIEALAPALGATKGSAYWHFPNRQALLRATLERWEAEDTERVIALADAESIPIDRLRTLFASVLRYVDENPVELSLARAADNPAVADVLSRVTERRLGYLGRLFQDLGYPGAEARRRALMAYTSYLGHAQLVASAPGTLPRRRADARAYAEELLRVLTAPDAPRLDA